VGKFSIVIERLGRKSCRQLSERIVMLLIELIGNQHRDEFGAILGV
jgi:hypothetical protein